MGGGGRMEAPPERGTFFRFQVYERVGKSFISVYEDPKSQITNAI